MTHGWKITAIIASIAGSGCATLVGVDDYSVGDPEGGGAEVELPALPAMPDGPHVPACEECVARECDGLRRECLKSERCTALLECHGRCSDLVLRVGERLFVLAERALVELGERRRAALRAEVEDKKSPFTVDNGYCAAPLVAFSGRLYAGAQKRGLLYEIGTGD